MEFNNTELPDFVENAPIGLHWVDNEGIIIWANKAELDMLGYSSEEYIGQPIAKFHVDPAQIKHILYSLKNRETLTQFESEIRCRNGSTRSVHISTNVLWKEDEFVHTRCFTVDTTPQKKLFGALKESEARFRQILERLPVAVYTCDLEGRITAYNEAAANLWGRCPEIGKDMWCGSWKISKPDGSSLPLDECPMALCLKEKRSVPGHEIIIMRPDGNKRYVLPHPEPLMDASGNITGAVNTLVDITEVKMADEAMRISEKKYRQLASTLEIEVKDRTKELEKINEKLKKSEELYHKMIDEVEDYAILLMDKEGIVQNWNRGAEKIKGYKEEEIVGKSFKIFYPPKEQKDGLPEKLIQEAAENGKALHEGWRVRKDGSTFWGSVVITCIHDKDNGIIGFSKVTRDLTERKIAEENEKKYTRELEFQNKELRQFAYVASHDLKEPLRKIIFYNTYISDESSTKLSEKEITYLNRSLDAARRMQLLIDDLLDYSKTNDPYQNFERVDLNSILKDVTNDLKEFNENKQVIIHSDQLPVVKAVRFQMKQLLDNLVGNALKYHHPDRNPEIRITCETMKGKDFTAKEELSDRNYYKISIIDNGIGFDNSYAEKIFELFQRLNEKTIHSGTGIGLSICRKIVENHNGFITASGKSGEGATFDIYLPQNGDADSSLL
ncbi:MAG: sensor signal transduction histidine kinase [Chitinophagaceae bacterium]|nr:sensor signal transduction histidine kinase [Chitinophagaceae bacterium]